MLAQKLKAMTSGELFEICWLTVDDMRDGADTVYMMAVNELETKVDDKTFLELINKLDKKLDLKAA